MLSGFVRIASLAAILALTSGVERAVWTSSDGVDLVYIAPSESIRVGPIAEEKVYITKKSKSFVRAGKIFVSLKDYLNTTNSEGLDTSRRGTSLKKQGNFGLFNPSWSRPSCCRRGVNMQTSTRFIDGSLRIGLVPCQWNYCQECEDSSTRTCYQLRNRCTRNGANSPFMIQNCPRMCGLCSSSFNTFDRFTTRNPFGPFPTPYGPPRNPYGPPQGPEPYRPPQVPGPYRPPQGPFPYRPPQTPYRPPPTPYRPPTTPYRPPPNPTLPQTSPQSPAVNVKVYSSRHTFPYVYKYTVESSYTYPYMTGRPGDVDSFHMYIRPHPHFTTPVYFCANLNHEAEYISNTPCGPGSSTKYTLYGSTSRSEDSEYLIMFTTDIGSSQQPNNNPVLSTRLSRSLEKCCGYEKLDAVLFVPDPSKVTQSPPPPQTPYYPPNTPYNPPQTPYYPPNTPYNPPQTPYVPPYQPPTPYNPPQTPYVPPLITARPPSNTNKFNRACLDAHNYFRAMHNTPPLQWDTRLAASSARWAQYLLDASEEGPGQVKPGYSRTPNWPHSERKSRPDNAGENILWQINVGAALGDKSTLLWYNEIFDYNPSDPSRGRGGRPVGHYTQLLWKDTKKIGCSLRSKPLSKQQQSSFSSIASYVVAHYSPTGNVFSSGFGGPNFHAINVLPVKAGSCQSPSNCGGNSNCLGYSGMTCTCNNQRPVCSGSGSGGCVVHCERTGFVYSNFFSDCRGLNSCSCTDTGATCR